MTENTLDQIEIELEEAKKKVKDMEAMDRLKQNKDFKDIFMEGYFKDAASHLVLLKALPEMQEEQHQVSIVKRMDAIGHLREHIRGIYQMGRAAKNSLNEMEETRVEILAEEA
jgi:hypothetical protein